jgi:hypothetical protein
VLKYGAIAGGEKSTVDAAFQILEFQGENHLYKSSSI